MGIRKVAALLGIAAIMLAACSTGGSTAPSGGASDCTIAVSWNNYQQPRWAAADEPNIKKVVEDAGATYISRDANLSNETQASDVDTLISQGADVLILLAQDTTAILPTVQKAKDAGVPVIAYDRLIEDPDILYITFDNVKVGEAEAAAILEKVPTGNYVLIKGDPGDPNASTFLPKGWDDAGLGAKVASGDITIIGPADGTYTDAWSTETAQGNMEAIIDSAVAANTPIDAILAENDSTALGVVAALTAKNYGYPPLSGQDGDKANLNNVALGKQYVDVWKNANELGKAAAQAALQMCQGTAMGDVSINIDSSVAPEAGNTPTNFDTPGGNTVKSLVLKPTPITAENLTDVMNAGWWVTKDDICVGVTSSDPGAAACGV
jgi:D-xylose transport system substrate-binding protein